MQFTLTGFTEHLGFRVFAFVGADTDRSNRPFTVRADLALSRQYGIAVQELPLLCRRLLEAQCEGSKSPAFTYDEGEMQSHVRIAAAARAAAAERRKQPRRPAATPVTSPWRGARP